MELVTVSRAVGTLRLEGGYGEVRKKDGTLYQPIVNFSRSKAFSETNSVTKERVVPRWRHLIATGRNATSHQNGQLYSVIETVPYECTAYNPSAGPTDRAFAIYSDPMPNLARFILPPDSWSTSLASEEAENLAKERFLRRLIDANRSIQGGAALGELRKTLRMIRKPGRALWRKAQGLIHDSRKIRADTLRRNRRRPRPLRLKELSDRLTDKYLEETYGWTPLMLDIGGAAEAFDKLGDGHFGGEMISANAVVSKMTNHVTGSLTNAGYLHDINERQWREFYSSCRFFGRTEFVVDKPVRNIAQRFGLMPRDFVPTLWELTPYSFLIDYFTNLGDVIEGWSNGRAGLGWASISKRDEMLSISEFTAKPRSTYKIIDSKPGRYVSRNLSVSRQPYGGSFIPSFRLELPGLGRRWLNVGALAFARRQDLAAAARFLKQR